MKTRMSVLQILQQQKEIIVHNFKFLMANSFKQTQSHSLKNKRLKM